MSLSRQASPSPPPRSVACPRPIKPYRLHSFSGRRRGLIGRFSRSSSSDQQANARGRSLRARSQPRVQAAPVLELSSLLHHRAPRPVGRSWYHCVSLSFSVRGSSSATIWRAQLFAAETISPASFAVGSCLKVLSQLISERFLTPCQGPVGSAAQSWQACENAGCQTAVEKLDRTLWRPIDKRLQFVGRLRIVIPQVRYSLFCQLAKSPDFIDELVAVFASAVSRGVGVPDSFNSSSSRCMVLMCSSVIWLRPSQR